MEFAVASVQCPQTLAEVVEALLWEHGTTGLVTDDTLDPTFDAGSQNCRLIRAYFTLSDTAQFAQLRERIALSCLQLLEEAELEQSEEHTLAVNWALETDNEYQKKWRKFHTPLVVGQRFLICPPWDIRTSKDRITVVLQPTQAFGTGRHQSTQLMLEYMESLAFKRNSVIIDVGTGSGILAICAAMMSPNVRVLALDNDPIAARKAQENVNLNSLRGSVDVAAGSFNTLQSRPYHMLLANLQWEVFLDSFNELVECMKMAEISLLSGLLVHEGEKLETLLTPLGFEKVWQNGKEDWIAMAMSPMRKSAKFELTVIDNEPDK